MKTRGLPRLVILTLFLGVSGLVVAGYTSFRKDVAVMQVASLEDITWMSYQLEQELGRFRDSLSRFQIEGSGADVDEVNTRFDILWSRIALFQQGKIGRRLDIYDEDTLIIPRLFETVKLVDRRVVQLAEGDTSEAKSLLAEFTPYAEELRTFSRTVTLGEELKGREIRNQLQSGVDRTLLMGVFAVIIILASLVYISLESVRFKRLAMTNLKLADAAERASQAKSRFLTMMSHELRTPMNGVLGLLALSKQNATQPSQVRLLEQAESSGQQMVGLLADVMDFSVLQSDELTLDKKPFEIAHLSQTVRERFESLAQREGVSFQVSVSEDCPKRFSGDFRRLSQAYNHLAQYIVETAGTRDIAMEFAFNGGNLVMLLSFDYLSSAGEWTPDLILGGEMREGEKFTTDALGPTIARGYVEAMNGSILVDNPVGERITILVSVPIEEFSVSTLNVMIMANSDAMAAICRAALQREDIEFMQMGDDMNAHIVLIEAGNVAESESLERAVEQFPNALLIALGNPMNEEVFDFAIELPLDFQKLRDIVCRQIA